MCSVHIDSGALPTSVQLSKNINQLLLSIIEESDMCYFFQLTNCNTLLLFYHLRNGKIYGIFYLRIKWLILLNVFC